MGFVEFLRGYNVEVNREESPLFSLSVKSDILPNAYYVFNLEQKPYSKYKPFNFLYVANRSSYDIEIIINDSIIKKISAGTIESFNYDVIKAIHSLKIKNLDTTNAINKSDIEVLIQKQRVKLIDRV